MAQEKRQFGSSAGISLSRRDELAEPLGDFASQVPGSR